MFITGPDVIRAVTHEEVTKETARRRDDAQRDLRCRALRRGGRPRRAAADPRAAVVPPVEQQEDPPRRPTDDPADRAEPALNSLVPDQPEPAVRHEEGHRGGRRRRRASSRCTSTSRKNLVVGFARLGGRPVGIVANQPAVLAGVLDINASVKGARFVRFCDCFNVPLVVFEDVPGFLPGTEQEFRGIILHGAKLLYAFAEATVPKLTVDHAQGLRRRVLRHGLEAHPHRLQLRLADRRDRRDGARRRGATSSIDASSRTRAQVGAELRHGARRRSTARSSPTRTSPPSAGTSTRSSSRRTRGRS